MQDLIKINSFQKSRLSIFKSHSCRGLAVFFAFFILLSISWISEVTSIIWFTSKACESLSAWKSMLESTDFVWKVSASLLDQITDEAFSLHKIEKIQMISSNSTLCAQHWISFWKYVVPASQADIDDSDCGWDAAMWLCQNDIRRNTEPLRVWKSGSKR